jgi:hypothetical protein
VRWDLAEEQEEEEEEDNKKCNKNNKKKGGKTASFHVPRARLEELEFLHVTVRI